jgi:nucleoid-associated protein Lsr2
MGNANAGRLRGFVSAAGIMANVFRSGVRPGSDDATCMAPLPALGVQPRTVGDFCAVRQFIGKVAVGVPPTTFNGNGGLLRPYRLMIVYAYALFNEWNGVHVAQKIQTLFIDDIDGSEAEGTVRFALDGAEYEIDLNAKNAEALRKALSRYVEAARRSSGTTARRPGRAGRRAAASGLNTTEVREWAKAQGIDVKDRGRVPAELVVRFRAATGN